MATPMYWSMCFVAFEDELCHEKTIVKSCRCERWSWNSRLAEALWFRLDAREKREEKVKAEDAQRAAKKSH